MNMSYCRFRNTAGDLQDCVNALEEMKRLGSELADYNPAEEYDERLEELKLSRDEDDARREIIQLAKRIVEEFAEPDAPGRADLEGGPTMFCGRCRQTKPDVGNVTCDDCTAEIYGSHTKDLILKGEVYEAGYSARVAAKEAEKVRLAQRARYANRRGWSDVTPFEIIERKNATTFVIREMRAQLDKKPKLLGVGGFGVVMDNSTQRWLITQRIDGHTETIRLRKDGTWRNPNGTIFVLADEPRKFYDYNF